MNQTCFAGQKHEADEGIQTRGGLQHGRVLTGLQADQRSPQEKRDLAQGLHSGKGYGIAIISQACRSQMTRATKWHRGELNLTFADNKNRC